MESKEMTPISDYFTAKAEQALRFAGAAPDVDPTPLADWAREARTRTTPPAGVIVTQDGRVIAETTRTRDTPNAPSATYINLDTLPDGVSLVGGNVVDLAISELQRTLGERLAHLGFGEVARGRAPRMTGTSLKSGRLALGLSQDSLADALGVRCDTVKKWESGKDPIPYAMPGEMGALAETRAAEIRGHFGLD